MEASEKGSEKFISDIRQIMTDLLDNSIPEEISTNYVADLYLAKYFYNDDLDILENIESILADIDKKNINNNVLNNISDELGTNTKELLQDIARKIHERINNSLE